MKTLGTIARTLAILVSLADEPSACASCGPPPPEPEAPAPDPLPAADELASLTGGRRLIVEAPNHFPNLVSDEFSEVLQEFMREADRS